MSSTGTLKWTFDWIWCKKVVKIHTHLPNSLKLRVKQIFGISMHSVAATRRHHYQGKAKKVFFDKWTSIDWITPLFKKLTPDEISGNEFELLEVFAGRLYWKTCNTKEVNEERQILFLRDKKVIENNPPTKSVLRKHVLRSVLQSSKWRRLLCKDFDGRNSCQWGWQKVENEMMPLWTTLPEPRTYAENYLNMANGCIR